MARLLVGGSLEDQLMVSKLRSWWSAVCGICVGAPAQAEALGCLVALVNPAAIRGSKLRNLLVELEKDRQKL